MSASLSSMLPSRANAVNMAGVDAATRAQMEAELQKRKLISAGVSPSSGKYVGLAMAMAENEANNKDMAMAKAGQQADQQNFAGLMQVAKLSEQEKMDAQNKIQQEQQLALAYDRMGVQNNQFNIAYQNQKNQRLNGGGGGIGSPSGLPFSSSFDSDNTSPANQAEGIMQSVRSGAVNRQPDMRTATARAKTGNSIVDAQAEQDAQYELAHTAKDKERKAILKDTQESEFRTKYTIPEAEARLKINQARVSEIDNPYKDANVTMKAISNMTGSPLYTEEQLNKNPSLFADGNFVAYQVPGADKLVVVDKNLDINAMLDGRVAKTEKPVVARASLYSNEKGAKDLADAILDANETDPMNPKYRTDIARPGQPEKWVANQAGRELIAKHNREFKNNPKTDPYEIIDELSANKKNDGVAGKQVAPVADISVHPAFTKASAIDKAKALDAIKRGAKPEDVAKLLSQVYNPSQVSAK